MYMYVLSWQLLNPRMRASKTILQSQRVAADDSDLLTLPSVDNSQADTHVSLNNVRPRSFSHPRIGQEYVGQDLFMCHIAD